MTRDEAIARLCRLMADVNAELTGWDSAADCVCEAAKLKDPARYRNDGVSIEWIETVVRDRLKVETKKEGG